MNKKGFVFVETIIVITILITALVLIYASFVNVLNGEKIRTNYDDTAYLYRTVYLKSFLENNNVSVLYNAVEKNHSVRFNCSYPGLFENGSLDATNNDYVDAESFCESLLLDLNVEVMYMTKYNVSDLKKCDFSKSESEDNSSPCSILSSSMDNETFNYFKTLKSYGNNLEDINGYRLIVVYRTPNINNCENIDSDEYDQTHGTKCEIETGSRYYSSLKINDADNKQPIYRVDLNVTNGKADYDFYRTASGRSVNIKITPNSGYSVKNATINCTNNQVAKVVGDNLVIDSVSNNTTCNVDLNAVCSIPNGQTYQFTNSGVNEFTTPCRGKYEMTVCGANGGGTKPGNGVCVTGTIKLSKNTTFYLNVGGIGTNNVGGTNGGGSPYSLTDGTIYGGGGSSDIRTDANSLTSRIIVGGGGGGTAIKNDLIAKGGNASFPNGEDGEIVSTAECRSVVTACNECSNDTDCEDVTECGCYINAGKGASSEGGASAYYIYRETSGYFNRQFSQKGQFGKALNYGGGGGYYGGGSGIISKNSILAPGGGSSCINGSSSSCANNSDNLDYAFLTNSFAPNNGSGKIIIKLVESE